MITMSAIKASDIKAVLFLLFVSVVLLSLVFFVKYQPDIDMLSGLASTMLGILILSLFIKIVVK